MSEEPVSPERLIQGYLSTIERLKRGLKRSRDDLRWAEEHMGKFEAERDYLRSRLAAIEAERDRAVGALGRIGAGKLRRDIPFDGAANTSESLHCPQCGCAVSVCDSWLEKNPCPGAIARRALAHATPGVASHSLQPVTPGLDRATIEACARAAEKSYRSRVENMNHLSGEGAATVAVAWAARCIRALATPPIPEKERP